ncbi:transcriptional regulator [Desulfonema limicola]|nr:transcriptional regulator [Desulfonema limicola]
MNFITKRKKGINRGFLWLVCTLFFFTLILAECLNIKTIHAEEPPSWYRLRTNSIPHQPQDVIIDSEGGLWVTAQDETEYENSLWYHAPGADDGVFQYITDNRRSNYLSPEYSTLVEKPELDAPLLYAIKDRQGNTWYSLKNRKVLCEKPDSTWITFDMQNTQYTDISTVNVDSAHKIRLIDEQPEGQTKLFISARGIIHINANMEKVDSRIVSSEYSNDFINDALIDSQGRYWVVSSRGVEKGTSLIHTEWINLPDNLSAPSLEFPITRIEEDSLGNIWFSSNAYGSDGIYCYTLSSEWIKYDLTKLLSVFNNQVYNMASGNAGSMWFGVLGGGLLNYVPSEAGGQWIQYKGSELGLNSEQIISLASTDEGLWFVSGYTPGVSGNGTGVHCLTFNNGQPQLKSYTYREQSTALTSNRINIAAADKSGGVWFPAYDAPSIARLKADGTWQQFRGMAGTQTLGEFGIVAAGTDNTNKVYFIPQGCQPVAYDLADEQWVDLPDLPEDIIHYYGLHIDPDNGKWFCGSFGAYYMEPDNTKVTRYSSPEIPEFADNYVEAVLVDDSKNVWFMTRTGLTLMKKGTNGNEPEWVLFTRDDGFSGYQGEYRVDLDDKGQVWNAEKQKLDSQTNSWVSVTDTSDYDNRHLRFLNGKIPADMDMSGALFDPGTLNYDGMTLDTKGNIYFTGGMSQC